MVESEIKDLQKEPLYKLYEEGIIKNDPKALYRFIEKFKPVIYKYSRYTDRMHDFNDLVQFFMEKIIYYHKKEIEKEKKIDFTKKENEAILVKFTRECVLQGVNILLSKKKSQSHMNDFKPYTPLDECFNVSGKYISQETRFFQEDFVSSLTKKIKNICSEKCFKVYQALLLGIQSTKELQKETSLQKQEIEESRQELIELWNSLDFESERELYLSY